MDRICRIKYDGKAKFRYSELGFFKIKSSSKIGLNVGELGNPVPAIWHSSSLQSVQPFKSLTGLTSGSNPSI